MSGLWHQYTSMPVSYMLIIILLAHDTFWVSLSAWWWYTFSSYLTVIGVHEMHAQIHPNYSQITILLVVDFYSPLTYFRMTHPFPVADTLPIKTLVAKQLPSKYYEYSTKVLLLGNSQQFTMSAINTFLWVLKIAVKALANLNL